MLLFSSLHLICFNMFFLFISTTKQSINPIIITSKYNQPINSGFLKNKKIRPSGIKIKVARSIKGKNKFKHIKNLDLILSFLDVKIFTFLKASIFIVTDKIGKEINGIRYLGWEECLEMQNSGLVEIFSHSKRHVFYDRLSIRSIHDDVEESYKIIEEKLGKKRLKVFAYPYGAYTKETVWALKINGINMQFYDIGVNNFNDFDKDYIKRINIPCEMTGEEIIEEINNMK